jgi:aspartate/methionine/tyrosine aminotransferase
MEILARAQQLERSGRDVIHLEIGEPDFPTPPRVLEAAAECLRKGHVRYTPAAGLPELRAAIASHYQTRYGAAIAPERIVVTPGASGAFLLALGLLLEPGEQVALADPGYPCYRNFVQLFGGEPLNVPVNMDTRFQLEPSLLEDHWSRGLSGVIVASPGNPAGTSLTIAALQEIIGQAADRDGFVISDEIYHGLEYGRPLPTAAQFSSEALVINSFSKYFGMTGWRLGWVVVPAALVGPAEKLAQNIFIAPSTPSQVAALASFSPENLAELERRRVELQERRDFLVRGLVDLGFRIGAKPEGAFYVFADCSGLTSDSATFAASLLEETGVAITPGMDFGYNHPHRYLRFAYTTPISRLDEALQRLGEFIRRVKPPVQEAMLDCTPLVSPSSL